ncbi:hypothetical protein [Saccharopolyspora phatthalungensis]|uniref:Uncharacterized protein n=1 Tax=Saccharopolyspora phatthalungensis TaxID=664693 RepID=A0A840PYX8_9PSEU|nr:hypothetical protein [Saccharopolyspora phatthalungensis]MBB5153184.1 hypothetical protein [Saccharopolyspora phatthalungensis]
MLKNVPVVLEGYKARVVEEPVMKSYKNRDTGKAEIATGQDGAPLYEMSVFMKAVPTEEGKRAPKGFEMKVTLEAEPPADVVEGELVALVNPRISQYHLDNGAQGVTLKATGVTLAG